MIYKLSYFEKLALTADEFEKLAKKLDPKAKVRNRGDCVFPADHSRVTDNQDHFPLSSESQARNALARANQFSSAPKWYNGSLQSLTNSVVRKVKNKYPSIDISKKSSKPGKG